MRWYDDLYVGYNLLDKKRQVMWKIKRGKQQFNKYVITLPFNDYDVLDIYPSNVLTQKWYKDSDIVIVGIAEGREEAMDMVQLIIMDCLNSTGGCKVKDYILNLMNEERRVAYGTYIVTYFKNNWYYCIIYSGACFTYFVFSYNICRKSKWKY